MCQNSSKNKILIIYGSLNSVPSPEGAAPAKVIYQTVTALDDTFFRVLSNWNPKLKNENFNSSLFLFVKPNWIDTCLLFLLKLKYPYKKRKEFFITAQDSQLLYFIAVCRFVRKHRYQKIIVHVAPGLVMLLKKVFPKKDIIFYHHGTSLHRKLNEEQWQLLLKSTNNRIIGVNKKALTRANEVFKYQMDAENYFNVPNGIQESIVNIEKNTVLDAEKFNILFSGRICKEKGVLELIKSYEILFKKNRNVNLIVVGGAGTKRNIGAGKSYIEVCKTYCSKNNLPVQFIGFQPQSIVYSYLKSVDLVVLPTNPFLSEEGMSLALLEAMSYGKPLIATDSGGNSEIVINGFNGFVIPNMDNYETVMATKIQEIINSEELNLKFSKNSKKLFKEKHTSKAMATNFIKALEHFNYV